MQTKLYSTLVRFSLGLLFAIPLALPGAVPQQSRTLSFADRVTYQRAIENVYWQHRIWPKDSPDPKPSLDAVMWGATIEQKVKDYLHNSELVKQKSHQPITANQLQAEMDRMAQNTREPRVLKELFAALDNDPFVIAECLARPILAERLLTNFPARDEESLDSSNSKEKQMPEVVTGATTNYVLPYISNEPSECDDDWAPTSRTNAPTHRIWHTAVWTGSEMIVWGGADVDSPYTNTGGRYNPSTDSWSATSTTNAPAGRWSHTAVWTGTEMIVWGGFDINGSFNSGGRYNPLTDSWTATTTTNAPSARSYHTAVWTGSEMIVWGGGVNTGGRYNPETDSWIATTTTNAPSAREIHTAVWTGSEMIVWGGYFSDGNNNYFNTGGRYNPKTDSWTATNTTNAPTARWRQTAVWTGSEMIVWGGQDANGRQINTGGRYNPSSDSWIATSTTNAPTGRFYHTAVWTGSEMIVWGGDAALFATNTGGRYNPGTDSWTATSTTSAPSSREVHTAVWTGSEMIVWGGWTHYGLPFRTGGRYCAQASAPITLEAHVHRQGDKNVVVLTWSPADGGNVNVSRNGVVMSTIADDGSGQDNLGTHTGIFTYQVCETDSGDCSNEVRVRVQADD